jgi:hypothetical protein
MKVKAGVWYQVKKAGLNKAIIENLANIKSEV